MPLTMRSVAVVALLVLASHAEAAETWTYASSDHFEVYTTAGAGTARESLTYFERIHAFFAEQLRFSPQKKTPTRLIIFANDRQFAPYRPNDVAAAFYLAGSDRDYIVMGRFDEESEDIVAHEYVHLLIKDSAYKLPVWLNEGLAEFFSTATPEGGKMTFGKVPRDRLAYLRSGVSLIDLNRLFAVGHESPEYNTRSHAGVFYSESWALTHMLATSDRYRGNWDDFFRLMANGARTADAMAQAYKKTPEVVSRDLINYIQQDQYLYRPTPYRVPPDAKYDTRAADAFEGQLVTANLLANSSRSEENARVAFEKLEQERPKDVGLLESRGYFELHRGKLQTAIPYFERAVAQGSMNVKMLVDYARLDQANAATIIAKAMALAPDNADVRLENARVLVREGKSAEAIRSLEGFKNLDRQQAFDFAQIAANAYMQLDRPDDARQAAALLAAFAEEGAQTEFAKRLAKSIDDYVARRAAFASQLPRRAAEPSPAAAGETPVPRAGAATAETLVTVEGRIRNIACQNLDTVLEILVDGKTRRVLLDGAIKVVSRPGFTFNPGCGPQDTPVTVSYNPGADAARNTVGSLRVLDFSKP